MQETKIDVPEGIRYLSQWEEFGQKLPNCHFILNKTLTGVGATQYFLGNEKKIILASPRCSLIDNKRDKHPNVWFYRDMSDNALTDGDGKKTKPKKKATFEEIQKYNDEVVKYVSACYINNNVPKIMVTYDSLGHVIDALKSISPDELDSWTLVIDEFQVIFGDSSFKSLTEMKFLENSKSFKKAIFLSATPYLKVYMEAMDEFKNLPYYELVWPKTMEEKAIVTNIPIKKGESRNKICRKIIDKMKAGETVKFGVKEIDTKEAVFYINNVQDIIQIVKKCRLKPSEVNILCSKSNEDKLKKAGLSLGNFPKEGEPHKMFTFATKSVFLGVDFYSECAMSYIFADPSQTTLALDISTDLPQILGRQRLDRNRYRHEAILFIKENSLGLNDNEFAEYIKNKENATEEWINDFNSKPQNLQAMEITRSRRIMELDRYKNDYVMVVDDPQTGTPTLAFNRLYRLAEIRAWEISKKNFRNEYSVICEQDKAGITGTIGTKSVNPEVLSFKATFEGTRITDQKIKGYCEFRKIHPDLIDEVDFVSPKYADYWDALGYDNLKALGFQESRIKTALKEPSPFDDTLDKVIEGIRKNLKEKRYENKKIKEELDKEYKKAGLKKTAVAKDIGKYVTAKPHQDSKTGKRYYDIQSLYQKNISVFPFVWRPNKPMILTIDRFLNIIKTGKYTIKKSKTETKELIDVIQEIRTKDNHDEQSKIKKDWLPVACINGTFKYKDDHGIENYSSFLAIDYDGFTNAEDMEKAKDYLKTKPWVYAIFETPSGKGLKAIVLHNSTNPTKHWNLYMQIMNACKLPQTDTGVMDLSRGQFFSYDPNLWKNPTPSAYNFIFDPTLSIPPKPTRKFVSALGNETTIDETKLDSFVSDFLNDLWRNILTDDAILTRLDKHWKENRKEYFEVGKRHHSMLIMAGTLCKAGIVKERTKEYLVKSFPDVKATEINGVIEYAYNNNAFGCDRRTYKK